MKRTIQAGQACNLEVHARAKLAYVSDICRNRMSIPLGILYIVCIYCHKVHLSTQVGTQVGTSVHKTQLPKMSTLELFSNITSPVSDDLRDGTAFKYAPYLVTAIFVLAIVYSKRESYPDLPRLNPKGPLEFGWAKRLNHFMVHSPELLAEASRRFGDNPFKLFTDLGDIVVVPAKYANELKNHRGMNFMEVGVDVSLLCCIFFLLILGRPFC